MQHRSFRADDRSYYSLIKKDIQKIALSLGFDETRVGKIDIIVSELTSNLGKHAIGGEILVGSGKSLGGEYIEIISLDDGPGIPDISRVMTDGYSSVSTMGHGLGSIRRLSDQFDMYSLKGWGTILMARVFKEDLPVFKKEWFDFRPLNVAKPGETVSGDGYCFLETPTGFKVLIGDGLGHGIEANRAVMEASAAFEACEETNTVETIRYLHAQIRKTRGMVGVVIFYDGTTRRWNLSGVGNISVRWMGRANVRNYTSYNGIIGHNIPTSMNDLELSQEEFSQFIACSDGIRSRWDLVKFPTIYKHQGTITAAVLYKEFGRRSDDTSVIVCKSF